MASVGNLHFAQKRASKKWIKYKGVHSIWMKWQTEINQSCKFNRRTFPYKKSVYFHKNKISEMEGDPFVSILSSGLLPEDLFLANCIDWSRLNSVVSRIFAIHLHCKFNWRRRWMWVREFGLIVLFMIEGRFWKWK